MNELSIDVRVSRSDGWKQRIVNPTLILEETGRSQLIVREFEFNNSRYFISIGADQKLVVLDFEKLSRFAWKVDLDRQLTSDSAGLSKVTFEKRYEWLGVLDPHGSIEGEATIVNRGESDVIIDRLWADCGCLTVMQFQKCQLKPGDHVNCHYVLHSRPGIIAQEISALVADGSTESIISFPIIAWVPESMIISEK